MSKVVETMFRLFFLPSIKLLLLSDELNGCLVL